LVECAEDSRAVFGLFVCKLAIDGTFYLTGLLQDLEGGAVGLQVAKDESLVTAHRSTGPVQRLLETEENMSWGRQPDTISADPVQLIGT